MFKLIGIPLLLLHLLGLLDDLIAILESISVNVGNIEMTRPTASSRVAIFGSLLFWFGRISNRTGREILSRQTDLHQSTREVASKLLEVATFVVIFLLLLNVMGINLTALAVFGGALGVGLGFGLQAIASNFISGLIILFDRSVTIGDYVETRRRPTGIVRELNAALDHARDLRGQGRDRAEREVHRRNLHQLDPQGQAPALPGGFLGGLQQRHRPAGRHHQGRRRLPSRRC